MMWLSKVKQFLFTILESEATQHKLYHRDEDGTEELITLLNKLKLPLNVQKPYISSISSNNLLENLNESNNILKEVVTKLTNEKHYHSVRISGAMESCPSECKYFSGRKLVSHLEGNKERKIDNEPLAPIPLEDNRKPKVSSGLKTKADTKAKLKTKEQDYGKVEANGMKKASPKDQGDIKSKNQDNIKVKGKNKDVNGNHKKEQSLDKSNTKDPKPIKNENDNEKKKKPTHDAEDMLMASMLKSQQEKDSTKTKKEPKLEKQPVIPKIEELPKPKRKSVKEEKDDTITATYVSESVVECDYHIIEPTQMVQGTGLVPIQSRTELDTGSVKPLLFKVKQTLIDNEKATESTITSTTTSKSAKTKSKINASDSRLGRGVISYSLSNRDFIEKGWTLLPTTKIMRRMNVYKMVPSHPEYDWFKNHQNKKVIMYDTGERLAEIDDNDNGKWYYKNGRLALNYYNLQESSSGYRYVVYSSGERDAFGKKLPVTVLATFDYLGNGVVYDHYGNERLKYNQSEGVIIDDKIGAPGHWKWHTLNEPPVLQPQFIDTYEKSDACLEKLLRSKHADKSDTSSTKKKDSDLDMIAIELENIMKEKANKLLQEFKPFQIKMKALKINDHFSLKIIDQSKIYLTFRDSLTFMKLNIGMLLMSNEIVDTIAAELYQVATPYDYYPPKTQSIADIQNILEKARHFGKSSSCNERNT